MTIKFSMKGDEMQSLYSLAWFGKTASATSAADPVFSGYHAAEPTVDVEDDATLEEAEVLSAAMNVQTANEPSAEQVEWMHTRKQREAERVMQLFNLGFTNL
jgi:hypothetical protein